MTKRTRSRAGWAGVCWLMVGCQIEPDPGLDAAAPPLPVRDGSAGPSPMDASVPADAGAPDAGLPHEASAPVPNVPGADGGSRADAALPTSDAAVAGDAAVVADAGSAFDMLAQQCVDTINRHRATLGLAPLRRATAEQEACSNRGAQKDATANAPHSSAGSCRGLGAQNSCPGWGFGPRTAFSSLSAALDGCLQSMWDEGAPPVPVATCINDYVGCFLKYGHYINMSDKNSKVVSCGFFDMGKNTFWMNQDFGG